MTEFKQIIGRGTRINEDYDKLYFTIMDFRRATALFADPDFDGDPVQIYEPGEEDAIAPPEESEAPFTGRIGEGGPDDETNFPLPGAEWPDGQGPVPPTRYYINNVRVAVATERVQYLDESGRLITESLRDYSRNAVRSSYASLDDFLAVWNDAERKQVILEELANNGVFLEELAELVGRDYDAFDLVCHVAFDAPPLTRKERADQVKKRHVFGKYGAKARAVLESLLQKYADSGISSVESMEILKVDPLTAHGTPVEIVKLFGDRAGYLTAIRELEAALYQDAA